MARRKKRPRSQRPRRRASNSAWPPNETVLAKLAKLTERSANEVKILVGHLDEVNGIRTLLNGVSSSKDILLFEAHGKVDSWKYEQPPSPTVLFSHAVEKQYDQS